MHGVCMRFVCNKIVGIIMIWFDDVTKNGQHGLNRVILKANWCLCVRVVILAYIILRSIIVNKTMHTLFETIATATAYISKRFLSGLLFTQANSFICTQYPHKVTQTHNNSQCVTLTHSHTLARKYTHTCMDRVRVSDRYTTNAKRVYSRFGNNNKENVINTKRDIYPRIVLLLFLIAFHSISLFGARVTWMSEKERKQRDTHTHTHTHIENKLDAQACVWFLLRALAQ